ncbi:MAG: 7TM diverse intracellular signaling domain-containing protein, partial [Thermoanaerobaculum sp.]
MPNGKKNQTRARWGIRLWLVSLVFGAVGGGHVLWAQPCTVSTDLIAWHPPQTGEGPAPFPPDTETRKLPPQGKELLPGSYFLRVKAANASPNPITCVVLPDKLVALAELFTAEGTKPLARTGWFLPLDERAMKSPQAVLPAVLPPGTTTFWLRLWVPANSPKIPSSLTLQVETLEAFTITQRRFDHAHGVYGGIMLAVVLYNLFLFFSLRERLYLLYVLYASFFGFIWLVRAGMGLTFLWPNWPLWDAQAHYFMIGLAIIFGNAFSSAFLELPVKAPRLARGLQGISVFVSLLLVGAALQRFSWIEVPLALAAAGACSLYVAAGLLRLRQKSPEARYFLLATGMVIIGTVVYIAAFLRLLPTTFFTANSTQLGSAAEMVLLAFALGHKIRHLRQQKVAAEELSRLDPLTGLANRRLLNEQMELEWRRVYRQGSTLGIVF